MQVCFAIPGDLDSPTGGYGYARRVIRALPSQGIEPVHVPLPGRYPLVNDAGVAAAQAAMATLPPGQPILLDGLAGGALPIELLADAPGPVVMLCHHPLAFEAGLRSDEAAQLRESERAALAACKAVVTTSHATGEILRREYGVDGARLTVAPPGTDPAPRAPADGPCRILSVGSLTRRKRHAMPVEALARLRDADWTLQIVGPFTDEAVVADLTDRIARHGLADRITLRGPLSTAALAAAYQSADLFVLASEYEGFGMAFTEAMSHGLPVLGIRCDAVEEATAGGALLSDDAGFGDALGALIRDRAARSELADGCWTTAQTFLRWEQTAAILADVLRRVA